MKANFHNKNFALSLAFIMRFRATRKWPIAFGFALEIIDCVNSPYVVRQATKSFIFRCLGGDANTTDDRVQVPESRNHLPVS